MAILYYLVFCSALLKPSCYTPRNYFLATDWDAVTAVSVSENIHVQWRQQETSQVRYLTPGTPVKLNSRQVNHVSKPDWLRFHCDLISLYLTLFSLTDFTVTLSPPGGTITKTLFVCSLFQCVCSNKTYGTNTEMTCSAASNEPLSDAASYRLSWSDSHTPNWLTEVLSLYMRIYTGDNKKHRRPFTSDMPVKSN